MGHNPSAQILCVSYAQDLSDKLSRDCRSVMASNWYKATFGTRLSTQRQSVQEFKTKDEGCRLATSIDGVLTVASVSYQGIVIRVLVLFFLIQGLMAMRELKRRTGVASPASPTASPTAEPSVPRQEPPTTS